MVNNTNVNVLKRREIKLNKIYLFLTDSYEDEYYYISEVTTHYIKMQGCGGHRVCKPAELKKKYLEYDGRDLSEDIVRKINNNKRHDRNYQIMLEKLK